MQTNLSEKKYPWASMGMNSEEDEFKRIEREAKHRVQDDDDDTQVYKKPWVGLTDEEIESAISAGFARGLDDGNVPNKIVINYVRVIEAALRSKNT